MPLAESVEAVREFLDRGGNVLFAIGGVTLLMWTLILERLYYFRRIAPRETERVERLWEERLDHSSWQSEQVRKLLVSEVRSSLHESLLLIRTLVALCPLLGLLGTVTGMIEVFDVLAISGTGNPRAMAAGVSRATIPTMAGMVAALSGLALSVQLDRFAIHATTRVADSLTQS